MRRQLWLILLILVPLLISPHQAQAAVRKPVTVNPEATRLTKGSSNVTRDPRTVTPEKPLGDPLPPLTHANCPAIRNAIIDFDGLSRTTGNNVYKCVTEEAAIVTFIRAPTCAPPRLPETQQAACPGGVAGTFRQTRAWTIAPYPTCELPTSWLPTAPTAAECVPPSPEPGVCIGRVCRLSWTYPASAPVPDGFRIVYGRSQRELTQVIQVTGTVSAREVTLPEVGEWHFAVLAFKANASDSVLSNIEVRTVRQ